MVYAYQPVNPLNAFAQSFQLAQGIRQTQQAEQAKLDEMRVQKANQAAFVEDVNAWRMNPTRERWAELQVKYPQLAEQAKPLADLYGERGKEAILDVGVRFLSTQGEGRKQILEEAAVAADNSRMPETASLFKQALQMYETNPDAAEATIRAALIKENGDVYDKLFKRGQAVENFLQFKEILGPEKAEEIAGVTPKDGIQVLPNGMVIAGPESPLVKAMSGGADLPTVTTREQLEALPDGAEFFGPDGKKRVKGGAGSNASGNFR